MRIHMRNLNRSDTNTKLNPREPYFTCLKISPEIIPYTKSGNLFEHLENLLIMARNVRTMTARVIWQMKLPTLFPTIRPPSQALVITLIVGSPLLPIPDFGRPYQLTKLFFHLSSLFSISMSPIIFSASTIGTFQPVPQVALSLEMRPAHPIKLSTH